jgi:hypothetical protein
MPVTEVSICSNALIRLGDKPIASFTESDVRATRCANLWPDVRDDILRAKPWTCAKKRVLLAPLTEGPAFGYTKAFQKPSDWLRTIQVGYDGDGTTFADESGQILADLDVLPLTYIWRNENPATWDAALVNVMTIAMAAQLAYAVTQSASVQANQMQLLEQALRRAGALSGQDDGPDELGDYDLIASRFSGRG